ncbi:hypothetical protein DRH14_02385 [Candidatus Shapirobacteria bacterium]|nr:MAG: hypothetical protein DRH14_02385 [Candidatus Shapirobacteria bacterium]
MKRFWAGAEKWCFVFFLLLLPGQLGKHFWPEWSYVKGIRVDYLSPTFYLTDLLFLLLVSLRWLNKGWSYKKCLRKWWWFGVLVLLNLIWANNWKIAGYGWLRFFSWWWLIDYVKKESRSNKKWGKMKKLLTKIIPWWLVVESCLGMAQVVNGGSIDGLFYWLGERRFSYLSLGVAKFKLFWEMRVRAYGTFSHPNSMAGFMLVALMLWGIVKKRRDWKWWVVFWFGIVGILLSGSRAIWLASVVGLMVNNYKKYLKLWKKQKDVVKRLGWGLLVLGGILLILGIVGDWSWSGWDRQSLKKRLMLNRYAIEMLEDNFWLGVGRSNFLVSLFKYEAESRVFWLQPVHNIFLLILTELGVVGLLFLLKWWLVLFGGGKKRRAILKILGMIVLTGMVDHYWLSLEQNWWLMALVLGWW